MNALVDQCGGGQLRGKFDQMDTKVPFLSMTLVQGLTVVGMMILVALFLDRMQNLNRASQAEHEKRAQEDRRANPFCPSGKHENQFSTGPNVCDFRFRLGRRTPSARTATREERTQELRLLPVESPGRVGGHAFGNPAPALSPQG